MEIIYKTKLPAEKLPYYRLTEYMNENYEDPELCQWFDYLQKRNIPCAVAMGSRNPNDARLAVWVMGQEHQEHPGLENVETIGRIVMTHLWPHRYRP